MTLTGSWGRPGCRGPRGYWARVWGDSAGSVTHRGQVTDLGMIYRCWGDTVLTRPAFTMALFTRFPSCFLSCFSRRLSFHSHSSCVRTWDHYNTHKCHKTELWSDNSDCFTIHDMNTANFQFFDCAFLWRKKKSDIYKTNIYCSQFRINICMLPQTYVVLLNRIITFLLMCLFFNCTTQHCFPPSICMFISKGQTVSTYRWLQCV